MKMKLLIFFLLVYTSSFAQSVKLSAGVPVNFGNKNLPGSIGINASAEYPIALNFAVKASVTFAPPLFDMKNELKTYSYGITGIELLCDYKPFNWNTAPFLETGAGEYFPNVSHNGNAGFYNGKQFTASNFANSLGFTIGAGIEFKQSSKIHFMLLAKQTIINSNYRTSYFDDTPSENKDMNLSAFGISFNIVFNI